MNIKTYLTLASAIMIVAAFAEDKQATTDGVKPRMTAEERIASLGGFVTYPGSQKGMVAFIDTQSAVDIRPAFEELFTHFEHQVPVKIELTKATLSDAKSLKENAKANFAVVFVDDATSPSLSVFPDNCYAVVNFAKYKTGLKLPNDEQKYKYRCAKAALKAFSMLCGGCGSRYPGHVLAAHTPQELDFAQDKLPIDIQDSIKKYLGAAGVTPLRKTIYRKAVQEGWAPTPTNDVQKAIWDDIRQLPSKPIKIEFDPKRRK